MRVKILIVAGMLVMATMLSVSASRAEWLDTGSNAREQNSFRYGGER